MKRCFNILCLVAFLMLPVYITAQVPTVSTSVDKTKIVIGQQITYKVTLHMPDNTYRLKWFEVPENFGSFVVAARNKIDSTYANGLLGFSQTLLLTSFDSGRQVIAPLVLSLTNYKTDSSYVMLTDSIAIDVGYAPDDNVLPFHDIKPIINVDYRNQWWFWPIIGLAVLLIVLLLILWMKKRKKTEEKAPITLTPPYEEAVSLLDELKKEELPAKGKTKMFFLKLTDIFKRYLTRTSDQSKMHLTGEELIAEMHGEIPEMELFSRFASCIRMADAIKFAKLGVGVEECEESMTIIRQMLETLNALKKEEKDDL